ncbi:hypothetical protein Tco_0363031 [Tanacetum coccineum]
MELVKERYDLPRLVSLDVFRKGKRCEIIAGIDRNLNMGKGDGWMLFSEFDFEAKYHLGKANVDVVPWSRRRSEAKNAFG